MKSKSLLVALLGLVVVGAVFILRRKSSNQASTVNQPVANVSQIKIGYLNLLASTPLFVAQETGSLSTISGGAEVSEFKSSNELASALLTGRIDIAVSGAVNAVLDAMNTSGKRAEIVMLNCYTAADSAGNSTDYLLSRPGLSIGDLKGRTIAFFPGSVSRMAAHLGLEPKGLKEGDYNFVEMGPGEWLPALTSRRIDAVWAVEPAATAILRAKVGVPLIAGFSAQIMNPMPLSGMWWRREGLTGQQKKQILVVFQNALNTIKQDSKTTRTLLAKRMGLPPEIAENVVLNQWILLPDEDGKRLLVQLGELLVKESVVQKSPPPSEWIYQK